MKHFTTQREIGNGSVRKDIKVPIFQAIRNLDGPKSTNQASGARGTGPIKVPRNLVRPKSTNQAIGARRNWAQQGPAGPKAPIKHQRGCFYRKCTPINIETRIKKKQEQKNKKTRNKKNVARKKTRRAVPGKHFVIYEFEIY